MLGTISLIGAIALGAMGVTAWIVIPLAVLNAFIGLHASPGKAEMLRERGTYWSVFLGSLPLQALLVLVLFGVGYLGRMLFS